MKYLLSTLILSSTCLLSFAQNALQHSDSIVIDGEVEKSITYTLAALDTFPTQALKDYVIYNHKGEVRDSLNNLRGLTLKALLAPVKFTYQNPKELNEFYIVLIASDGYRVVLSWNEIYNTEVGNHFFIVSDMKGFSHFQQDHRVLFLSESDIKSGRRYIKGLQEIRVMRLG